MFVIKIWACYCGFKLNWLSNSEWLEFINLVKGDTFMFMQMINFSYIYYLEVWIRVFQRCYPKPALFISITGSVCIGRRGPPWGAAAVVLIFVKSFHVNCFYETRNTATPRPAVGRRGEREEKISSHAPECAWHCSGRGQCRRRGPPWGAAAARVKIWLFG